MPRITETQNTEFKENWRDEYLRVICAFANSDGGKLILGVNDEGIAVGIKGAKKLLEDIPNKIRNRLGIIPSVNKVAYQLGFQLKISKRAMAQNPGTKFWQMCSSKRA